MKDELYQHLKARLPDGHGECLNLTEVMMLTGFSPDKAKAEFSFRGKSKMKFITLTELAKQLED